MRSATAPRSPRSLPRASRGTCASTLNGKTTSLLAEVLRPFPHRSPPCGRASPSGRAIVAKTRPSEVSEGPMPREAALARALVELADTLVADFDVVDLLVLLTDRC